MRKGQVAAMKHVRLGIIALGVILLLCPVLGWAAHPTLEERVDALEEQAKQKTPVEFSYRPRRGMYVEAADKSWGFNARARMHYRMMFWDSKALDSEGFSQGDLALRRVRFNNRFYWDDEFYEMNFELDVGGDRSIQLQKADFTINADHISSWYPAITIGPRVSSFFNKHDTNWGSSTGGLFDRSMFQDGAGIGAGSQNNAIALNWAKIKVGGGELLLQAMYSNQGLTNIADQSRPNTSKRAWHFATNYQPFKKSKNKWLKGMDVGVGVQLDKIHPDESGRSFFRVRTTERNRLTLMEVGYDLEPESTRTYITPGFGWKVGPNWLRTAMAWNNGEFADDHGDVKGKMWRIMDELFVYSPKGAFTGSTKTAGSLMVFAGYERNDYEADDNGIRGGFDENYATNLNVGFWYFVREGLRFGAEFGQYKVDKIGRGAGDLEDVDVGDSVTFNTFELGMTFDF